MRAFLEISGNSTSACPSRRQGAFDCSLLKPGLCLPSYRIRAPKPSSRSILTLRVLPPLLERTRRFSCSLSRCCFPLSQHRRQIPDVRSRVKIKLEATPLTHERFLRRDGGSYGPFVPAGQGQLPGQRTALPGFLCVGDSTFPGIGMPAVAASGLIAANSLVSPLEHWAMLDRIRL